MSASACTGTTVTRASSSRLDEQPIGTFDRDATDAALPKQPAELAEAFLVGLPARYRGGCFMGGPSLGDALSRLWVPRAWCFLSAAVSDGATPTGRLQRFDL